MSQSALRLDGVTKRFGAAMAVSDLSLDVARGEFVSLLGPSGCGKTTTLRMIAGLESPSSGSILIAGHDVSRVPPEARDIGMVFQSLALFPHMSVADNIAFGLRMRGRSRDRLADAVRAALVRVRLPGFENRYPDSLSGGQQQRVALARALVTSPAVLLLDEPFSALDRSLREELTLEFAALLREIDATTVFVTHDQEEAFSMSDRVAVIEGGRLMQYDTPSQVFSRPTSARVARFVGMSNLLSVTHLADGSLSCALGLLRWAGEPGHCNATLVGFRPEDIEIEGSTDSPFGLRFAARVIRSVFRGRQVQLDLEVENCSTLPLRMMVDSGRAVPPTDSRQVFIVPQDRLHLMEE